MNEKKKKILPIILLAATGLLAIIGVFFAMGAATPITEVVNNLLQNPKYVDLDDMQLDEMAQALSGSMTPEDLEQLKVKHRSDEARDILKADLKYLKALFDRLQSEKENAGKANFSGNVDNGVTLSLGGGMDMPVMTTQEVQQPDIGGSMDIEV